MATSYHFTKDFFFTKARMVVGRPAGRTYRRWTFMATRMGELHVRASVIILDPGHPASQITISASVSRWKKPIACQPSPRCRNKHSPAMARHDPITICFPFTGDTIGGSHISVLGLIKAMDREQYRPLITVQKPGGAIARLFEENGLSVESPFAWKGLEFDSRIGFSQLAGTARDLGPKVRYSTPTNRSISSTAMTAARTLLGVWQRGWLAANYYGIIAEIRRPRGCVSLPLCLRTRCFRCPVSPSREPGIYSAARQDAGRPQPIRHGDRRRPDGDAAAP